ncbi:MAG: dienelactone hydrolase family protein [Candidatus Latescibacteria bacterium]|nr:dienelactone hydrolase family protein [Candidatus Latescibacterota bacterium]
MARKTSVPQILPHTAPLDWEGDLAARMVAGLHQYLLRRTEAAPARRARRWKAGEGAIAVKRRELRRLIGAVDERLPAALQLLSEPAHPGPLAQGPEYQIWAVRWPVFKNVEGEGLLLRPTGRTRASVVALPDCAWTPEQLAGLAPGLSPRARFAHRLAEAGCQVLVPCLIDRGDTHSGNPAIRMTNQPHREFIYRAAFELGRHLIGFEVQKIAAALDCLNADGQPMGVIGYGEGGLLALHAAALDTRLRATAVSGYFGPRQELWQEPIYRNVFGLLEQFGDAELAAMVAPRALCVEHCPHPQISGPPPVTPQRSGAAPGGITTPTAAAVQAEFTRACQLADGRHTFSFCTSTLPGSDALLARFLRNLGVEGRRKPRAGKVRRLSPLPDAAARQQRQFHQLVDHTQELLAQAEFRRRDFWARADDRSVQSWQQSCRWYRNHLSKEVIGELPAPRMALNPRTRLAYDEPKYRGYEVVLDVYPEVYAYGILLIPRDIRPGQKRPVVVCQHGLEGRPQDVADPQVESPYYHRYACHLAEQGFVTFSPQNPYIGGETYRVLQRLANPLKLSLFSFIVRQHQRILEWLAGLPFVDEKRLAFYGLSYGGKTAMRVPALLEQYCLSICSADYNEWIWKNVSVRHLYSYMFHAEYEMPEFDLGNTFNYAEMSWLIFPRPFMVERGHHDGVAPDEWVAYEFARTKRRYVLSGLGEKAQIEFFDGPHTINGRETFRFLAEQLNWGGAPTGRAKRGGNARRRPGKPAARPPR